MTAVASSVGSAPPRPRPARPARKRAAPERPYINRELSWLDYAARVLFEARDARNPLLDRVNFLTIFASMLDEFFQIRVAGLRQQVHAGSTTTSPDGRTAGEQLVAARKRVLELVADLSADLGRDPARRSPARASRSSSTPRSRSTTPASASGSSTRSTRSSRRSRSTPATRSRTSRRSASRSRSGCATPRPTSAASPGSRSPRSCRGSTRSSRTASCSSTRSSRPTSTCCSAAWRSSSTTCSGSPATPTSRSRRTRPTTCSWRSRRSSGGGASARPSGSRSSGRCRRRRGRSCSRGLGLGEDDAYEVRGMLDLTGLRDLVDLDRPDLKSEPWTPVTPPRLVPPDEDEPADVFAAIRVGDLLVHHPYESFARRSSGSSRQAVDDPEVLTIKMTLYRTSGDSPIVRDLIRAAERGKQVVVLVEIKARFDEEANIVWARKLEQAGAHVVYGLVGLKTHSKVGPRRPPRGLRASAATSTSAPATTTPKTARLYTDLGLLSLPAGARRRRDGPVQRPDRPVPPARRSGGCSSRRTASGRGSSSSSSARSGTRTVGHEARIVLKLNAIVDEPSIDALYRASQAGVRVDIIVRGGCSLLPGVKGVSENISVRSIVGEFLEHSRIWGFANGGDSRLVHRLGRPDGPQPRSAGRGDRPGRGSRGPGPARRRSSRSCSPTTAGRGSSGPDAVWRRTEEITRRARHDRHPRGAEGAGARRLDGHRGPAPAAAPVPARSTRGHERRTIGRVSPTPAAPRPVEIELKYRAPRRGRRRSLPARRRARRLPPDQPRPLDPARGSLHRHGRRRARPGRVRRPAAADREGRRRSSVKSIGRARRRQRRRDASPRGARGTGRPDRRPARLAAVRRPLADPRAVRRRAARRARHDPPAAPQAEARARRDDRRGQPRRGRRGRPEPGRRAIRRARGRAASTATRPALARIEAVLASDPGLTPSTGPSSSPPSPAIRATTTKRGKRASALPPEPRGGGRGRSRSFPTTVRPRRRRSSKR